MTAHNHGYDPTCKETRLPDGKMVGECMTTPTPVKRYDISQGPGAISGDEQASMECCEEGEYVKHDDYTALPSRVESAEGLLREAMAAHRGQLPSEAADLYGGGCGCPQCEASRAHFTRFPDKGVSNGG